MPSSLSVLNSAGLGPTCTKIQYTIFDIRPPRCRIRARPEGGGAPPVYRLIQIKAAGITPWHPFSTFWRKAVTPGEVTTLVVIIGAFIAFAATLAWYSR